MTITRFLVLSILFHLAIAVGFSLLPKRAKEKTREIMARLVTPEEIRQPAPIPEPPPSPAPKVRQLPPAGKQAPKPPPQQRRAAPPLFKIIRPTPTPDRPVVPGVGREEGKPLPEGVIPRGEPEGGKGGAQGKAKIPDSDQYSDKPGYLPKEGLFDRNIIGDIARRKTAPEGVEGTKDRPITLDTRNYRYMGYMRKLAGKLGQAWRDQLVESSMRGFYGDAWLLLTIGKDGRIEAVEIIRTSGYKAFDDWTIKVLRDAEPFWPLPDEWGQESYPIIINMKHSRTGYTVR